VKRSRRVRRSREVKVLRLKSMGPAHSGEEQTTFTKKINGDYAKALNLGKAQKVEPVQQE